MNNNVEASYKKGVRVCIIKAQLPTIISFTISPVHKFQLPLQQAV